MPFLRPPASPIPNAHFPIHMHALILNFSSYCQTLFTLVSVGGWLNECMLYFFIAKHDNIAWQFPASVVYIRLPYTIHVNLTL